MRGGPADGPLPGGLTVAASGAGAPSGSGLRRGALRPATDAPATGEWSGTLVATRNLVVEHILSGASDQPVDYRQEADEWVAVLAGAAVMEVEGERLEMGPGDWVFLPGGLPHRVVRTAAGTSWLAVHLAPETGA